MSLFKGIAIFIGWLSSSLAGIVAILYASGYLVTISRLHLLGLDGLVVHGNDYFFGKAANSFWPWANNSAR